jgi:hypothetical protein
MSWTNYRRRIDVQFRLHQWRMNAIKADKQFHPPMPKSETTAGAQNAALDAPVPEQGTLSKPATVRHRWMNSISGGAA